MRLIAGHDHYAAAYAHVVEAHARQRSAHAAPFAHSREEAPHQLVIVLGLGHGVVEGEECARLLPGQRQLLGRLAPHVYSYFFVFHISDNVREAALYRLPLRSCAKLTKILQSLKSAVTSVLCPEPHSSIKCDWSHIIRT